MTYINKGDTIVKTEQLFVYGIFLGEKNRRDYGMSNPRYDTVADFVTFGDYIVSAAPVDDGTGAQLTGLVVDVDPDFWNDIDALEGGYERILVETYSHGMAFMYAAPGTLEALRTEGEEQASGQAIKA